MSVDYLSYTDDFHCVPIVGLKKIYISYVFKEELISITPPLLPKAI